ncbi:MAG: hypothetical protein ACK4ZU_01990 [Allorhizobium sp.]
MEYNENESEEFQKWKLNHEEALAAHAAHRADLAQMFSSALSFGLEAMRTAVLVNGGAVVAMLAFIGATYNAPSDEVASVRSALLTPAFLFALGAIAAGSASGFAYFAQSLFCRALESYTMEWNWPYVKEANHSRAKLRFGMFWQIMSVSFVIISYLALLAGLALAFQVLR